MKRILSFLLTLALVFSLCGCASLTSLTGGSPQKVSPTLPPARQTGDAPVGDEGMSYQFYQPLYLPSRDGQRLVARQVLLEGERGGSVARSVVLSLLSAREDEQTLNLGRDISLQLSGGATQVETAGDVCTVNLASSALGLDYEDYYRLGLAVAATLDGVDGIRYVNVLTADQAVGLDVAGNLPAGTLTAHPGEELSVLWDQMAMRRTPVGVDAATVSINATATLYFPLKDTGGFTPETRNLYFSGQTPQVMAQTLLRALSAGPMYVSGAAALPDLVSLSMREPDVSEMPDGGRLVTFFFPGDMAARLRRAGVGWDSFVGALTYTMTTFIPAVGAVRVYQGESMVMSLEDSIYGDPVFENGFLRRRHFASGLRDLADIYLARDGLLTLAQRAVPAARAFSPRMPLTLLMAGPLSGEELDAVLPTGLNDHDILGLSAEGDTLRVNLSARFAQRLSAGEVDEQLACYAMVDTLCEALGLTRVRFYFNGEVVESLGGSLWWGGEFLYNRALTEENRG
ncbi:MAG: GerMN domain-containing protein [Clostridia bacterium]|nr:GerMN domain-containing protein [Clostridia bacterium]